MRTLSLFLILVVYCLCQDNIFQYTGYINVDEELNSNLFYWFFKSQDGNHSAPVILWLQGGPGCSCTMGLFSEAFFCFFAALFNL